MGEREKISQSALGSAYLSFFNSAMATKGGKLRAYALWSWSQHSVSRLKPKGPFLCACVPDLRMDSFNTKNLALQAQKKLMSKMATKSMASLFIDDTSSEVLDELYRVTKEYTRNRKESQKIIKNLVKMVVKLGVLYRNNQFNTEELMLVDNFR